IPNLLVKGIGQAVIRAKGEKIYIANLMTQQGETGSFTASQHIEAIHAHVGEVFIESVLINEKELPPSIYENYREENAEPVKFDIERLQEMGINIIPKEIALIENGTVRHDAVNLADWLCEYTLQKRQMMQE